MFRTAFVIGSSDRQLEDQLRTFGARVTPVDAAQVAALTRPDADLPDIVVVDVRESTQLPPAVVMLKRQHPALGVVLVAARLDPALMLEAMRAGVNECVAEPLSAAELQAAIERLLGSKLAAAPGQVFAFVGSKGGIGTTTTAVNVAAALENFGRTILVDMHLAHGDAAVFFGAEPRFSIVDALENTHRLDEAFLRGLVVHTKGRPDLLASSDRPSLAPADANRLRMLIDFAAQHYEHVVLDVPRSDTSALDALERASTIAVVANQELATVRSAGRLTATLRKRYGKERVAIVISRFDTASQIGQDDVERVTGARVAHVLPSDYRLALQALNQGRPLVSVGHSALGAALTRLAGDLAGVQTAHAREPRGAGILSMFGARRA